MGAINAFALRGGEEIHQNEIFQKKTKQGEAVEDILFWKITWNFSFFYFTPGNSRQNKAHPWKFHKFLLDSLDWKFQGPKLGPLEIPHYFFLITLRNSTSFLINPLKFHMLFLWYLRKFHILNPPCFGFLLEWPNANVCEQWRRKGREGDELLHINYIN